jgi:hypothetical protein
MCKAQTIVKELLRCIQKVSLLSLCCLVFLSLLRVLFHFFHLCVKHVVLVDGGVQLGHLEHDSTHL